MKININHPSFISFLENVTKTITSEIDINTYFQLTPEKRIKLQKAVLLILRKSLKTRALVTDIEIKAFIIILQKKNEESENYEVSAILKDAIVNYDSFTALADKKIAVATKVIQ
jgi:hypothetical protein